MKFLVLAWLIALTACNTEPQESAQSDPAKERADCAVAFLLRSAAADFGMSQAMPPSEVRNVRARRLVRDDQIHCRATVLRAFTRTRANRHCSRHDRPGMFGAPQLAPGPFGAEL